MPSDKGEAQPRIPTGEELAKIVSLFREIMRWSQEQLAAVSGLSVRTIQRVERGATASFDTRRALARAFGLEDIDTFNKPVQVQSDADRKAAKEAFDRENITLALAPVSSGRGLAKLVEACDMDFSEPAFELEREAAEAFAGLVDYFRDYRDCAELYSEQQKLEVHEDLQNKIDGLKSLGISLRSAERRVFLRGDKAEKKPMEMIALYLVAFRLGQEPDQIATPRAIRLGV